jgi:hypothetical protein
MTGTKIQLADVPPASEHVTEYDRDHVKTYLRLLDAAADNADWREVADVVLGLDVASDPEHARRVHDAHLARARWMTTDGYRDLLSDNTPS